MSDVPGRINIAGDVISIIAGLAAVETPGIAALSGGFAGGPEEAVAMKSLSKGIKIDRADGVVSIDLYIVMDYGVRIPEVSWNVQENVKKRVEYMTGLSVNEVNIHIQGINMPKT